ncbi:MAG: Fic family protein [Elusimicrobiota bacterium]
MLYVWGRKDWPDFTWQSDRLMRRLGKARLAQGKLLAKISSIGLDFSKESRCEILIEETMKTSEIEGHKLDKEAVRSSVARRLGIRTVGLKKTDRNIEGLVDVILDATINYKMPLTLKRLQSWQAALFPTGYSSLKKINIGKFRPNTSMQVVSGPIGRQRIHFEAPPFYKLTSEMKGFINWWEKSSKGIDGLLRAGVAHFYFVTIHPFEDGNGRIARALSEMALAQDENLEKRYYSVSARIMLERNDYYKILERTQKGTIDITEWLEWFLDCFIRAIKDSEDSLSKVINKAVFWQAHTQITLNKNQIKVVNRLLDAGEGGFKGDLTTKKYVAMTRVSRATAYRDITDLVEKRILKKSKSGGRSVSYEILFPKQIRT